MRTMYDATLSNSMLNMKKVQDEIVQKEKSESLLPKQQEALEIAHQVH